MPGNPRPVLHPSLTRAIDRVYCNRRHASGPIGRSCASVAGRYRTQWTIGNPATGD